VKVFTKAQDLKLIRVGATPLDSILEAMKLAAKVKRAVAGEDE
jgi:hypothetical protein